MTTYATCSLCCESFPSDDLIEYEGRLLCRCCYEEQTCTDHTIHEYYCKHDGSLDDGFEIVTQLHNPPSHRQ